MGRSVIGHTGAALHATSTSPGFAVSQDGTLERVCILAVVSRAGYYRLLQEQTPDEDLQVQAAVQEIGLAHRRRSGIRRVTRALCRRKMSNGARLSRAPLLMAEGRLRQFRARGAGRQGRRPGDNECMRVALIWEAGVGAGLLLLGALMAASPMAYWRLRTAVPCLRVPMHLRQSPRDGEHEKRWSAWKLRTRSLGVCSVLLGILILSAVRHGEIPGPWPNPPYPGWPR